MIVEIRGRTFDVERLGLDEAFNGLELAQEIFGSARPPVSKVPALLKLFAKRAKVARTPDGRFDGAGAEGAPLVALQPFLDDVFKGEIGVAFDFVLKCVELEYGTFLDGLPGAAALQAQAPAKP